MKCAIGKGNEGSKAGACAITFSYGAFNGAADFFAPLRH
jgi:hypothetical protein